MDFSKCSALGYFFMEITADVTGCERRNTGRMLDVVYDQAKTVKENISHVPHNCPT